MFWAKIFLLFISTHAIICFTLTRSRTSIDDISRTTKPELKCYCGHPNAAREDCGWDGINKMQCESRGCCYDSGINDTKHCFCSNNSVNNYILTAKRTNVRVSKAFGSECSCDGTEGGKEGPGKRKFHVSCKEPKKGGQPVQWHINCSYESKTNIHNDCKKYNKNQEKHYEQLLQVIGAEICRQKPNKKCPQRNFNSVLCPEVPFIFIGSGIPK